MASQITANLPTLNFPREVDYPTQEDWAAFSAAAEQNFGILGGDWSTQMQLWKDQANAMSIESNNNADIAQSIANYQGDWTSQGYALGQSVSVSGVYYICKLTHITGQNPTDISSLYWNLALGNWSLKVNTDLSGYASKATPVDADLIPLSDSGASFGIKKLTWANLKATLNTGFKNLFVNGNKQVNQSGATTTDNAYNYDTHYKVGNNWFIFIDGKNIVSGEPYTLSWVGLATAGYYIGTAGALTINAQTFTPITNGSIITPTIASNQKLWIKFASDASGSTYSKVQLEPGTVPTPYEHRLYELEESFVQRVCEICQSQPYQGQSNIYDVNDNMVEFKYKAEKDKSPIITNLFPLVNMLAIYRQSLQASVFKCTTSDYNSTAIFVDARPY